MPTDFECFVDEIARGLVDDKWEAPIPFDDIHILPFPTDALPGPCAAFVEHLAESTQTPEEMAGLLALGVLATAFQSRYTVQITTDWSEPLCLYCAAVAPPGERKSAVISAMTRPIYEYERERQKESAEEVKRSQTEQEILEGELRSAKTAAAKGNIEARHRAYELSDKLSSFVPMHEYRLLVDDSTPEKLISLMEEQNGCLTVCSSEGGIFDAMQGRYENTINLDIYLKAHAGDPVVVDRVGRPSNRIDNPRLTMMLTIQPEVLEGIMKNSTLRGRGLCGRFLYAKCRSKVGFRNVSPEPVPSAVKMDYAAFIHRILSAQRHGVIMLSQEADRIRREYQERVEERLGEEWIGMRDWGGKLVGATARIAALLHCAQAIGEPSEQPISGEIMESAVQIAEYLGMCAEVVYMPRDENTEDAKYILSRLKDVNEISRSEALRKCRRFQKADDLSRGLELLKGMGYLRETAISTDGRPKTIIKMNPLMKGVTI